MRVPRSVAMTPIMLVAIRVDTDDTQTAIFCFYCKYYILVSNDKMCTCLYIIFIYVSFVPKIDWMLVHCPVNVQYAHLKMSKPLFC